MCVQGLLLHVGVANFIRVSKGAWTMLIALFKVCMLLITFIITVLMYFMHTLHVCTTCIHYMYSLACWLSSAAADILLGKLGTAFSNSSKLNRLQLADCFSHSHK